MAVEALATKLVLPFEASTPSHEWVRQRIGLIGPQGIGKSQLFANDPGAFYIDTEGTIGHLAVKRLPCRTWQDFREIGAALYAAKAGGAFPYTTIIVDTLDKLLERAEEQTIALAREKFKRVEINTIGDVPEGGGWANCSKLMTVALDSLDALPAALVLITHPKSVSIDDPTTGKYDKETIALWGQMAPKILGWTHHNLQIQAVGTNGRIVRARPWRGGVAKSHGNLVPDRWEWKTPDLAEEFKTLRALFT